MSEKTKTIYDRLAEIQEKLKAPKNQENTFAHFKYRSCEDILEAVKPLLKGLVLIITDEVIYFKTDRDPIKIEVKDSKGNMVNEVFASDRFYIKATAKLTDGKETIPADGWAREAFNKKGMDDSQITGSTSSYARKYALNGLFAIDDEKDADAQKPVEKKVAKQSFGIGETPRESNKCPLCGATGKYHKKDCPNRPKES